MSRTEIPGKFTPERDAIAEAIKRSRAFDRGEFASSYINDHGLSEYLDKLMGLSRYLEYVRSLGGDTIVFDVGAGTTRGVSDLQKSKFGEGIDFRATVLKRDSRIGENLGFEKTLITPVEELRGVKDKSVSGIIGLSSIAYSTAPETTARSIDRVLVDGGVVKADFMETEIDSIEGHPFTYRHSYHRFSEQFQGLGYDVCVDQLPGMQPVLIAIKPNGPILVNARNLMDMDSGVRDNQQLRNIDQAA